MKEILQITREEWLKHIEGILEEHGYENVATNTYEKTQIGSTGSQVVVINGQRMEAPGRPVVVKHSILLNGDGYIVDEDDGNCREFTQIVFETTINDESRGQLEHCFYWDEPNEILKVMNEIKIL